MRARLVSTVVVVLTGMLAACSEGQVGKRDVGAVLGGAGGGILGSQFGSGAGRTAATIAGVIIGGGLGGYVGQQMDENDRVKVSQALEYNDPGQPLPWRNSATGREYRVTPAAPYQTSSGQYCREFTQTIQVDNRQETAYGTACRQEDGTWRLTDMRQ